MQTELWEDERERGRCGVTGVGCDFESVDMCGWEQLTTNTMDWVRHKDGTPSSDTGPDGVDCDFDLVDICDWEQLIDDDMDWERRQGRTPSSDTGPDNDHTTGAGDNDNDDVDNDNNGYYMYIETTPLAGGETAVLASPSFTSTKSSICVKFAYNISNATATNTNHSATTTADNYTCCDSTTTTTSTAYTSSDIPANTTTNTSASNHQSW
nr:hypothetical protein BaRGS_022321 [Batillaria attramentaria]